jgi:AraC-like DNA-binding protein
MRSQLVAPALAIVVDAAGADAARALAAEFQLPADAATAAEVVLPLAALRALLDRAAVVADAPALGLVLAERFPRGGYGVLEYACRSAPTIRAALERIVRYVGLLNELVQMSLDERDGLVVIEQAIPGEPACVGRHANEFFLAYFLGRSRALSGTPLVPVRAWFAHAAPDDLAPLCQALGTTHVRFDAGRNGLALPAGVVDAPLLTADPPLLSLLEAQAERALAGVAPAGRIAAVVRQQVAKQLGAGPPALEPIAQALRLTRRTLQRRLADEGVAFQAIVDDVRRERAIEYVRDPRRPLGEIAYLLGYAELSPFLRAFKRWTGRTPSQVRGA